LPICLPEPIRTKLGLFFVPEKYRLFFLGCQ